MQFQRRYSRVAIDRLQSPVLQAIMRVWDAKRGERPCPLRDDLRPQDFAPFLRHLSLARVIDTGKDFEIRIVGDEIVQSYGENLTGRKLSSLSDLVGEAMVAAYQAVALECSPALLQGNFERTQNHHFRREVILMPLGSAGAVDFVLSAGMLMARDGRAGVNPEPVQGEAA